MNKLNIKISNQLNTKVLWKNFKKYLKKLKRYKRKLVFITAFLFLLPAILFAVILIPFNQKIFPNTFIAGVYVGGNNKEEALQILANNIKAPEKITLLTDKEVFEILSEKIDLSYNLDSSIQRAYFYSNSGNFLSDTYKKISLIFSPINLGLNLKIDEEKLNNELDQISSKVGFAPVYPSVSDVGGEVVIDKGRNGITLDTDATKITLLENLAMAKDEPVQIILEKDYVELSQEEEQNIQNRAQKLIGKKIDLTFEYQNFTAVKNVLLSFLNYENSYDQDQINIFVIDVASEVNRPYQNSVFMVKDGNVVEFTPSTDGVIVDENILQEKIKNSLKQLEETDDKSVSIEIPVTKTPAKIKNEDVNSLGINTLLGRGVSYFRGSIQNRIYNINHATKKFRGILVDPGKTFSFNEILGDVSELTGYKSAYVIKEGKTVLGDGGGVCQVSTTLFRAILDAGLPVVERRAHSYRVGYYEQGFPVGLDATVYYPTTDLKFINNTPAYLLIQSSIDIPRSTLTFEIYGTDDGRIAKTTKPAITSSTSPDEDLYVDDPTLPAGVIKQIEYKAWGARVVFDYTVTRDGETLTDKTFISNYRPWQAVFLRGVGPVN